MKQRMTIKKLGILFLIGTLSLNLVAQNTFEFRKQIAAGTDDAEER